VVVVLALAVLGAHGAVRLLDRVPPIGRPLVVAALAVGIVTEGWAAPIPTKRFDPLANPDDREAYRYLEATGRAGAVLELPMGPPEDPRELRYQYLTLRHGHRTVNGTSSYRPALTQFLLGEEQSPFADLSRLDAAVGFVRGMDVRYLVVHRGTFENPAVEAALMSELENDRRQVLGQHGVGRTVVFTLAPDEGRTVLGTERSVPPSAIHARASNAPDRLPLLFDKDRDTRWLSAGPQTGDEWIELQLDSPRNVSAVRMQTAERSFGDYPRELVIEAIDAAGEARTLFHGSVLPAFGRGFAVDHSYPSIDIVLPDNQARVIRLRQLGVTNKLFWSIHELELLERGRERTK
jgi:hypothetical protein